MRKAKEIRIGLSMMALGIISGMVGLIYTGHGDIALETTKVLLIVVGATIATLPYDED